MLSEPRKKRSVYENIHKNEEKFYAGTFHLVSYKYTCTTIIRVRRKMSKLMSMLIIFNTRMSPLILTMIQKPFENLQKNTSFFVID